MWLHLSLTPTICLPYNLNNKKNPIKSFPSSNNPSVTLIMFHTLTECVCNYDPLTPNQLAISLYCTILTTSNGFLSSYHLIMQLPVSVSSHLSFHFLNCCLSISTFTLDLKSILGMSLETNVLVIKYGGLTTL